MKKIIITYASICFGTFSFSQNIVINARFEKCIFNSRDTIIFDVENKSNKDLWLNTWGLFYYMKIKDIDGYEITPKYLEEKVAPNNEQFVLIKSLSKSELHVCTDFINRYPLESGKEYILEIKYYNSIIKQKSRTIIGSIQIPPVKFVICKK